MKGQRFARAAERETSDGNEPADAASSTEPVGANATIEGLEQALESGPLGRKRCMRR